MMFETPANIEPAQAIHATSESFAEVVRLLEEEKSTLERKLDVATKVRVNCRIGVRVKVTIRVTIAVGDRARGWGRCQINIAMCFGMYIKTSCKLVTISSCGNTGVLTIEEHPLLDLPGEKFRTDRDIQYKQI